MSNNKKGLTKFISKFIFKDLVDVEVINIRNTFLSDNTITLIVTIDHSKLWENSSDFNTTYSDLISELSSHSLDEILFDSIRYFGMFDNYTQIYYEHKNLYVYDPLIDFLKTQNFDFSTRITEYSPYFGIVIENDYIFDNNLISDAGFDLEKINIYNRDEIIDNRE